MMMGEPLDEKGLEVAEAAWHQTDMGLRWKLKDAIRAYLSTTAPTETEKPAPDGLEVVAWRHTLHMEHDQKTVTVDLEEEHPYGESGEDFDTSYTVTSEPLVSADQAQSALAAMRAEQTRISMGWAETLNALEAAEARANAAEEALEKAKTWHEEQDKSLSKQPPSSGPSGNQWARLQHQEQIAEILSTLNGAKP